MQRLEDSAGLDPEAPILEISLDLMHKSPHTFWLLLHRTLPQTSAQRASSPRKSSLTTCPHGLTWAVVSRPHPSKGHSKGNYSLNTVCTLHASSSWPPAVHNRLAPCWWPCWICPDLNSSHLWVAVSFQAQTSAKTLSLAMFVWAVFCPFKVKIVYF